MNHHPNHRWRTWTLAVCEGLLMGWLVWTVLFILKLVLKHPELVGEAAKKAFTRMPELTRQLHSVMTNANTGLLIFAVGAGVGFGALSSISQEAITSRVFRWLVVAMMTAIWIIALPLYDAVTMQDGAPGFTFADAVFSLAGMLAALAGLVWARRAE